MKFEPVDLEEAKRRWRLFHDKDEPRKLDQYELFWPKNLGAAGKGLTVYYSSDKWRPTGKFLRYYHDHDSGSVQVYHARDQIPWKTRPRAPVKSWPTSGTVLGYCVAWDVEQAGTGEVMHCYPPRGTKLCCFPDGSSLFTFHPRLGVQTLFVGSGLTVEARGIVG